MFLMFMNSHELFTVQPVVGHCDLIAGWNICTVGSVGLFDPGPGSAVVGSFVVGSLVISFLFLSCVFVVVDLGISFIDF